MKTLKRILAMTLAIMMVMGLSVAAFAADDPTYYCKTEAHTHSEDCVVAHEHTYEQMKTYAATKGLIGASDTITDAELEAWLANKPEFTTGTNEDGKFVTVPYYLEGLCSNDCVTNHPCGKTVHTHTDACKTKPVDPPKNEATSGSITIKNPQDGEEYKAYKIFDLKYIDTNEGENYNLPYTYFLPADSKWTSVVTKYGDDTTTTPAEEGSHNVGLILNPVLAADGTTVTGYNVSATEDFSAADFAKYLSANIPDGAKVETFTNNVASGLDFGYYLIVPSKVEYEEDGITQKVKLATLTSTDPDVEVSDKNEQPKVDKVIVDDPTPATEYPVKGNPTYTAYEIFSTSPIEGNSKISWGSGIDADAFSKYISGETEIEDSNTELKNAVAALKALYDYLDYPAPEDSDDYNTAYKWEGVYDATTDAETAFINLAKENLIGDGKDATLTQNAGSTYLVKKVKTVTGEADEVDYAIYVAGNDGKLALASNATFYEEPTPTQADAELRDPEEPVNEYEENTASVGETVNFKLTAKVPDMTGYEKYFFVVNDVMSKGLTFDGENSVVITLGGKTLVPGTDYTVKTQAIEVEKADGTKEPATEVRIVFNDMIQYKDQTGAEIVITYTATVNQDAVTEVINTNTAKIEYSNDPSIVPEWDDTDPEDPEDPKPEDENDPRDPGYEWNDPDYTGDDPTGVGPEDTTYTFVANIKLTKVDVSGNPLAGAKFSIEGTNQKIVVVNKQIFVEDENGTYYRLKDGTYTEAKPTSEAGTGEFAAAVSYEPVAADFVTFEYKEVNEAAAAGLYYKVDGEDEYVLIGDGENDTEKVDNVPVNAKIFQKVYNNLGLWFATDANEDISTTNATEVDKNNAADHVDATKLYKKVITETKDAYESTETKYRLETVIDETKNNDGVDDDTSKTYNYTAEGYVSDGTKAGSEKGVLTLGGLGAGTYEITEMIAPDGYNILNAPVTVVIGFEFNEENPEASVFTATVDGTDAAYDATTGTISFNVVNNQGTELPETGGIGTTIFYILGGLIVAGAGVLLITRKRMSEEEN